MTNRKLSQYIAPNVAPIVRAFLWLQFAILAMFIIFNIITHYFSNTFQHEEYTNKRAQEIVTFLSLQHYNRQLGIGLNNFAKLDEKILAIKIINNEKPVFLYEKSRTETSSARSFLKGYFFSKKNQTIKQDFLWKFQDEVVPATLILTTTPPTQAFVTTEISVAVLFAIFTLIALISVNNKAYLETKVFSKKINLAFSGKSGTSKNSLLSENGLQFLSEVNDVLDISLTKKLSNHTLSNEKIIESAHIKLSAEESLNQRELEIARRSVTRANRLKSKFIANTSHELLTPLNSIVGFSELLIDSQLKNQQQEFAARIHENALHLTTLVNDLVLFSSRNNNSLNLTYQTINVYELLHSIVSAFSRETEKKSLEFIVNYDTTHKLEIETDPVRLRQIIYNLIVNAIRHTDHGHVSLLASTDTEKQILTISICDTGCGIEPAKHENIFEAFISDGNNDIDNAGFGLGFGLGLAIVAELTQLLGANIDVKSNPDEGSQFELSIPLKNLNKNITDLNSIDNTRRLLIMGSYEPSLNMLAKRLAPYTFKTQCIEYYQPDNIQLEDWDAIIVDIACNFFNKENSKMLNKFLIDVNNNIPVTLLMPPTSELPNEFTQHSTFLNIASKPASLDTLLNVVALNKDFEENTKPINRPTTELNATRILVADDNESNVCLLDHLFTNNACIVETSIHGEDALTKISTYKYDLIVLDIRMQPLTGFDIFTKTKQSEINQLTPVIACTAHTSKNEYRRLLDFGFDKVIHKPVTSKEVQQLLQQYGYSPLPGPKQNMEANRSNYSINEPSSSISQSNNDSFDIDLAIQLADGNIKVAKKIFKLLVQDLEKSIQLHNNKKLNSLSLLLEHVHQLNGAAALTGAKELKKQANHLESILKQKPSINDSNVVNEHKKLLENIYSLLEWSKNQNIEKLFDASLALSNKTTNNTA